MALRTGSLGFQLAAGFLLVGVAPALLLGVVASTTTHRAMRETVEDRNRSVARAVAGEIERFLELHVTHLRELALSAPAPGVPPPLDAQRHVAIHLLSNPALRSILVLDGSGRVIIAEPPSPDTLGTDFSAQPFVREARARGEPTWSSSTLSMATGFPTVTLVVPGRTWIIVGYLDLDALERIAARPWAGTTTIAAVVDRDGKLIAHPDMRLVRQQADLGDIELVARATEGEERTGGFRFGGQAWLGSSTPVAATRWAVVAMDPVEAAAAPIDELRRLLFLATCAAAAIALGVGWLFTRRLLRPVGALAASTRRIAAGDPPAPRLEGGLAIDELEELGNQFDAMAAAVRARERALERSQRGYRRIVDAPLLLVVRAAPDGTILFANEAMARLNGLDDAAQLVGRSIVPFYADPSERDVVLRELRTTGRIVNRELRVKSLQGDERRTIANFVADEDGTTAVLVDVTDLRRAQEEREKLEQQLLHTQKMEAVGRLAGGVAHDFNNLLTAIIGYANVLRDELPPGDDRREAVDGILSASDRASHLTRSLLAYGRKQVLSRRPADLGAVVREAARLIGRVLGEDVRLVLELPDEPVRVLADPGQIDQVLMNLCTNARDAMPTGGTLTVRLRRVVVGAAAARALGLAAGGAFARVEVVDTGVGMTPDQLERAFEPFFTTKPAGKGTGLGLSIVQGIVRQHDGAVEVTSGAGEGTTVSIHLPLLPAELQAPPPAVAAIDSAPRGTETILLAEDDPQVRRVVRNILERGGYRVVEAVDGRSAVDAFAARKDAIDLCLLDVVMPGLNGREALEQIRRLAPGARALFTSGYAGDALDERIGAEEPLDFVPKPVVPAELLARVRAAIDRR